MDALVAAFVLRGKLMLAAVSACAQWLAVRVPVFYRIVFQGRHCVHPCFTDEKMGPKGDQEAAQGCTEWKSSHVNPG